MKSHFSIGRIARAVAALGLALPLAARADVVFYTSRTAWQTAAGPATFAENFSGFTQNTPFHTVPVALNGMTIRQEGQEQRMAWNEVDRPPLQFAPNSGSNAALLLTNFPEGTVFGIQIRLTFTTLNKAFGLESWGVDDEGAVLEVYSGTTLLGSQIMTGGNGDFLGYVLTGPETATSVRLRSATLNPGMVGERFYIDNLAGVAAVEPPAPVVPPVFASQPMTQTVAAGSTVVFNAPANGAASYRWERNDVPIAGATSALLVIRNASLSNAGSYVAFATNSSGTTPSSAAALTVLDPAPSEAGHLVNLSILASAGSGDQVLTIGAFVGGGAPTGVLPLVIRAVGPTLALPPFNVAGVLPDPAMTFFAAGNPTPIDANDNWGGNAVLSAAFRSVAAFDLPATSLDSAIVRASPGIAPGGYTVQVAGKGDARGVVIAELYDATLASRTAATPRLTNLSTRAQIDAGAVLTVGFVLGGRSARTVLVRGVGPSLATFGLSGVMADPRLELFDNHSGQRLGGNDDWLGNADLAAIATSVGAFALAGETSKDAVLVVTLPPGAFSARISGTGGTALVEVYEVP